MTAGCRPGDQGKAQGRDDVSEDQVNFGNPNTIVSSTTFGRITSAGAGRVIQLAAKVIW